METPFTDKLHTNYIPLRHAIEQIHQVIAGPLDAISQLTEKTAHLQTMVNDFSRERDELLKFVEDHRALLGVRRLPLELQQIFLHCLPTDRNAVKSSDEAPVLLGRVCKLWRDISLSTPQLWCSLHVPTPGSSFLKKHGHRTLLQRERAVDAWLGSCPLSMSFSSEYGMVHQEDALQQAIYFGRSRISLSVGKVWTSACRSTFMKAAYQLLQKEMSLFLKRSISGPFLYVIC